MDSLYKSFHTLKFSFWFFTRKSTTHPLIPLSTAMSLDNVTVNMSRLALARAIKTPDGDDTEADPWNKSVIFHQSHIPQAIEQHKGHRRGHGQHAARQNHSHRPQHDRMPQQRTPPPAQRPRSQAQVVASPQRQAQGSARKYATLKMRRFLHRK